MKIFVGLDTRQPVAAMVLMSSIIRHASKPIELVPLLYEQLPIVRRGLTGFTFSRYLVPWLMNYEGVGLFMDGDMVVTGDVHELAGWLNAPVSVVKGEQKFEWPSLMLFGCSGCRMLTPEYIETETPQNFEWASEIGELPREWNFCATSIWCWQ